MGITGQARCASRATGRRAAFMADAVLARYPIGLLMHFALQASGRSRCSRCATTGNNVAGHGGAAAGHARGGRVHPGVPRRPRCAGDPATLPIREDFRLRPPTPSGWSKLMMGRCWRMWMPVRQASGALRACATNPVGATRWLIGKTRRARPTTSCPTWRRWPAGESARS